jgi:hypothetical protein
MLLAGWLYSLFVIVVRPTTTKKNGSLIIFQKINKNKTPKRRSQAKK